MSKNMLLPNMGIVMILSH